MPVSPQLQAIVQMLRSHPATPDTPIEEVRRAFEQMASVLSMPPDVRCERTDAGGIPAEWVAAPGAEDRNVILYLHGGGYAFGSINTHRDIASRISRASGARVLLIEYHLAPEHPFPAALDDAVAAYRWLLSEGVDPARLILAGDSAGGGLTVATLIALRDAGDPLPAAAVCISPWVDQEGAGESLTTNADLDPMVQRDGLLAAAAAYHRGFGPRHPLVSPIHADLSRLPPMLIQVGTSETLLDDSRRLAARAKEAGMDVTLEPWEGMIHVWHLFAAVLPEGQQAIDRIGEYIREKLGVAAAVERAAG
jgi:monoterpene epsilon-lactone hydrolase